ncbi:hypothetical protein QBC38DRAFT_528798 [Podospora fimiseda]|uniref:Polyamine transport protein n=1 Tax=Podospora fimiseda TaxID=252190 RepID=A0AAN7BNE7_9PEZI|nr:hypothetical protein QBC38DRAFT_528798 [Podospora fimiseda]
MNANHSPEPPRKLPPHLSAGPEVACRHPSCCSTAIPPSLPNNDGPDSRVPSPNKAYQRALQYVSAGHFPWLDKSLVVPGPIGSAEGSAKSVLIPSSAQKHRSPSPKTATKSHGSSRFGHSHTRNGIQGRVCIDPQLHSAESHAKLHHPDLVKGADFCDAGAEAIQDTTIESAAKDRRIFPFKDLFDDSSSDEESPVMGYRYRKLTGGDVCKERVDVSVHKHHGHSSALKVRAAPGTTFKFNTSLEGRREVVSKVGPLAQIAPFKHTRKVLDSGIQLESRTQHDQDEIELYPGVMHASVDFDLKELASSGPIEQDEETVIYRSRRQTEGDRYPGWSAWKTNESLALPPIRWTPEPDQDFETSRDRHHQGHNHVSKVRPAILNSTDSDNEAQDTLWSNGKVWNQVIETGHSDPRKSTKMQLPVEDDKPPVERPKRGTRARRAETSQSASELVAYWESLSESGKTSQLNLDLTSTNKQLKPAISRGSLQQSTSIDPRRKTTTFTMGKPNNDDTTPATTRLDSERKSSILRDLSKAYETYQTKLTERPERKVSSANLLQTTPSPEPRRITGDPVGPDSIDFKFKRTVDDMEQLLGEAVVLANQVADDQISQRDSDHLASAPSVNETVPSVYSQSSDKEVQKQPIPVPVAVKVVTLQSATASVHSSSQHLPKHHRSVPGIRSGNVRIGIPERISSLRKVKTITEERQPRGLTELPLPSLRDRFLDISPPVSPLTLIPSRPKPLAKAPEVVNGDLSGDDAGRGCLVLGKTLKKSRSCLSCRSWIPLLNHRFSFSQKPGTTPTRVNEEEEHRGVVLGKAVPVSVPMEGVKRSGAWGFDGSNDCEEEQEEDEELLRRSAQTDGVSASEDLGPLPQFPMPPSSFRQDIEPENALSRRIDLRGKAHVSLRGYQGFNLARVYKRHPVARDWSTIRKRFTATVACLSTAGVGILIGIYAGLVPSIQYWIADLQHYAILGNVFFYVGLAIPSFLFWPLPLLHGRKPYILSSLVLSMPLLFPQAVAVSAQRSPYVSTWRWALLSSRAFMGLTLGFASMNFHSILMDLFGASLMSGNPHQEIVDKHDVRRHGGGMGAWLGLWTWCFVGSLGVGFLIGAAIIDSANPSWGFYVSMMIVTFILLLNVVCPEVRRSPFRRSVAEVRNGNRISRRVARGEVMMHRVQDGPTWWGQEVAHGVLLSLEMLRQPGFLVMALYTGWIYAQVVLIIVLLGALTSRSYSLRSPLVGLCVVFISIGALVAIPFQKANLFSRGRHHQLELNEDTFDKKFSATSHLLRRTIFCLFLPLVGIAYTFASAGPPIPVEIPTLFAALIGILSGLAISECNGLMMETFDTSDLQPGMTGRPRLRGQSNGRSASKRTNYSSFPRVTAGFAICHTIGYILAAVSTAVGGSAQRKLGQQAATGVVAGILMILTLLLLAVLIRFKDVQIIPESKTLEMEKWEKLRRESVARRSTLSGSGQLNQQPRQQPQNTLTDEEIWRPLLMGNPSSKMRRVNILELGSMTRWTEIRKKNKLIDETAAAHLNRAALESAATAIEETTTDLVRRVSSRRKPGVRSPGSRPGSPGALRRFYSTGNPVVRTNSPIPRADTPATISTVPPHRTTTSPGEDYSGAERGVMSQTVEEEDEDQIETMDVFEESDFLSSDGDADVGSEEGRGNIHGPAGDYYRDAVHGGHAHDAGPPALLHHLGPES